MKIMKVHEKASMALTRIMNMNMTMWMRPTKKNLCTYGIDFVLSAY